MFYQAIDLQQKWLASAGELAATGARLWEKSCVPFAAFPAVKGAAAMLDMFAHAAAPREKHSFGLHTTQIGGIDVAVTEEVVLEKPFGNLLRFKREGVEDSPRLLICAPMSGHFATLLRGTVERLLPGHDVYITDWANARHVPTSAGRFDLDDYVDYLIEFLETIGPGAHMLAVCQPSVPCSVAVALMNADTHPATPRTLTMMGGPIDTRQSPTSVNLLAQQRPYAWFENFVIHSVPSGYPGHGRAVYPGALQLSAFMTMNLANHMTSHWSMAKAHVAGDLEAETAIKTFYAEYRAVADMSAEYYLQTIDRVFQRQLLAKNAYRYRDRDVTMASITATAILAIEGGRDDISGPGQTKAALDLSTALDPAKKHYHLDPDAGHYGIFSGSRWRAKVAPVVEAWIAQWG